MNIPDDPEIPPFSVWQHGSGDTYFVICCSIDEDDGHSQFVNYTRVSGEDKRVWTRSREAFLRKFTRIT